MFRSLLILVAFVFHTHGAGLLARFEQGEKVDVMVLPQAAFFVAKESAPTSFLEPGLFETELRGFVSVELRAQYSFQMESSGPAELLINDKPVLTNGAFGISELSKPVRLNKGPNSVLFRMQGRMGIDTQVRLFWKGRNIAAPVPIPPEALSYAEEDPVLQRRTLLRRGADAFVEYRCFKCHAAPAREIDAPDLTTAGSRLSRGWMAEWIADPQKLRADTRMPRMVSTEEASAIADYLATLKEEQGKSASGERKAGEKLFAELQCAKCHSDDGGKARLEQASEKYLGGALARFLLNPQAHYRWNAMPNFKLSETEAANLSAFLGETPAVSSGRGEVDRGRELFEKVGCLNCHEAPGMNRFRPPAIIKSNAGCLEDSDTHAPRFKMERSAKEALIAYLESGDRSLAARESLLESTLRRTAAFRCGECHNSGDGVIRLEALGGKLRPEWVKKFIGGEVRYKPRPWLSARMPAFPALAETLAAGLAALHGVPPVTPTEGAVNQEGAETGAKLVSAAGGFSCVACHAVGTSSASTVVESPGINLAYSGERLLKSFFHRWLLNPLALDPATKMPVYFDENGRSQLVEFFDGDGSKQIEAIWEYLRLGEHMPSPPTP